MPILYGEAKNILSRYAGIGGKCPSAPDVDLFVRQVLEYMLISGQYGNIRKFCFNAVKCVFTAPPELEVPLKVKIDGKVGTVWDRWFEYHSARQLDENCLPADRALFEDPNRYVTAYEIPRGGARVGVSATCTEESDAHIIVQGKDVLGKDIFTFHEGEQISGELLRIRKGELRYTEQVFAKIEGIVKSKTNGYVQLLWVNPLTNLKGFLSDYSPLEETPSYRRYRITTPDCGDCVKVSVLARIKLKPAYADTDFIPFDSLYALQLAGQAMNSNYNDDVQTAKAKDDTYMNVVTKENEYKRVQNGQPIEVFHGLSAGLIKNIV